jgi:hypothetical protein
VLLSVFDQMMMMLRMAVVGVVVRTGGEGRRGKDGKQQDGSKNLFHGWDRSTRKAKAKAGKSQPAPKQERSE